MMSSLSAVEISTSVALAPSFVRPAPSGPKTPGRDSRRGPAAWRTQWVVRDPPVAPGDCEAAPEDAAPPCAAFERAQAFRLNRNWLNSRAARFSQFSRIFDSTPKRRRGCCEAGKAALLPPRDSTGRQECRPSARGFDPGSSLTDPVSSLASRPICARS